MTIPPKRLKRGGPIRAVNTERYEKNWARAYHSLERCGFVKGLPCLVADCHRRPSENAHTKVAGFSLKAEYTAIVPACAVHHREIDSGDGRDAFEQKYTLSLEAKAAETEALWQAHAARMGFDP